MPGEARRASWALFLSLAAVFVPRGTARPPGSTLVFASLSFFGYKVKVRYTVWPRISVASVQFCFYSFVVGFKFRRVSSSFDVLVVSFVKFCSLWSLRNLFLPSILGPAAFSWQIGCFASWWLEGRCVNLLVGLISVRFWLSRRPSTCLNSFLFELVRIVLPLELEISFL